MLSFNNAKRVDIEVLAVFEGNSSLCYAFLGTILIWFEKYYLLDLSKFILLSAPKTAKMLSKILLFIAKAPELKRSLIPFAKKHQFSSKKRFGVENNVALNRHVWSLWLLFGRLLRSLSIIWKILSSCSLGNVAVIVTMTELH